MTRLVRSAYLDTNVYVAAASPGSLRAPSEVVVHLATRRRLGAVGSVVLRRELLGACQKVGTRLPLERYERAILLELPTSRSVRHLGRVYASELSIKDNDALHLAFAVSVGVDIFVSWNREDLVKRRTRMGVREINQNLGRKSPVIVTPAELIHRTNFAARRGRLSLR